MPSDYYAPISDLLPASNVPDSISTLLANVGNLLSDLYYKDLIVEKSTDGDSAYVSLTLAVFHRIEFDLPADLKLVVFDSLSGSNTVATELPLSFSYRWEIIKYLREFDLDTFTETAEEYYDILLGIINASMEEFIAALVDQFHSADPDEFFAAYNGLSGITSLIQSSGTFEEQIEDYTNQIYTDCVNNATTLYARIYTEFIEGSTADETLGYLYELLKPWLGAFTKENLTRIITPQANLSIGNATTTASVALEFPRTMLVPLDINGNAIAAPAKSQLSLNIDSISFGTATGIEFEGQASLDLDYSEIPGTGFRIDANGGKIDVSDSKNIMEADADGRPASFNGVYFQNIILELPSSWDQSNTTSDNLIVSDALIGSEGGFSGKVALDPAGTSGPGSTPALKFTAFNVTFALESFNIEFHQNSVVAMEGVGIVSFPFLSNGGNPAEIDVTLSWDDINETYLVDLDATSLPPIDFGPFSVDINTLSFAYTDGAISNFDLKISLLTDALTEDIAGTIPGSVDLNITFDGQSYTFVLDSGQSPLFLLKKWEINVFDVVVALDSNFELTSWAMNSIFRVPQLKNSAGTNPEDIGVTMSYNSMTSLFALSASNVNDIKLFGMDLDINSVDLKFNSSGGSSTLDTFAIDFDLEIQGLEDGGSPTEINGIFGYAAGSYSASVSLTSQPSWDIFGATFNPSAFSIAFDDNTLTAFALSGDLIVNQLKDANNSSQTLPIALTIGYDGSNYSASAYPVPDMELGGLTVHDTDIEIEFSNTGNLNKFHLEGDIRHDSFRDANDDPVWASYEIDYDDVNQEYSVTVQNISFTMMGADVVLNLFTFEFDHNSVNLIQATGTINIDSIKDANGNATTIALDLMIIDKFDFYVKAAVSGGVPLKVPNVVEFTLYDLTIGRESGVWYIRFGSPPGLPQEGMMADILLDIPVLSKFIPEQIGVYSLKLDQNLNTSDENIFMKWEALDGLEVQGGANGITVSIPMQLSIFDVINVDGIKITFNNGDLKLTMSGNILLGPLVGTIKDVGINLNFLDATGNGNQGGNFGPFDLGDYGIAPPTGMGMSLDVSVFKGGGYLEYGDGEYAGVLQVSIIEVVTVTAIGIITTKIPQGNIKYSLVILITAEFQPIQLGFGFTLNGVGGLLGLHRTMDTLVLADGVKTNALSSILFPDDPVNNAPQIISDMRSAFPIKEDQFVFGPMAIIGWGTPTLISIELGLLFELPDPFKIVILGIVKTQLPDAELAIAQIQVNFIGVIDFDKKVMYFGASLYDSRITTVTLSGDMAFVLGWGDDPVFVFTAGGFHPAFEPPAGYGLEKMARMAAKVIDVDEGWFVLRLILDCYFAVTSNTAQFGAGVDFYAKIAVGTGEADLNFDVLFYFSPFSFQTNLTGRISIAVVGIDLISASLDFSLEGPRPYVLHGYAEFKILWAKKQFKIDHTWGEPDNTTYEKIDVYKEVEKDLKKLSNWESQIDTNAGRLVSLRYIDDPEDAVIMDPDGELTIKQKVAPLKITIEKLGNKYATVKQSYSLSAEVASQSYSASPNIVDVKDHFAPSYFKDKGAASKLTGPSFELYSNGITVRPGGDEDFEYGDYSVYREIRYEVVRIDINEYLYNTNPVSFTSASHTFALDAGNTIDNNTFRNGLSGSGVANSPVGRSRTQSDNGYMPGQTVSVSAEGFVVANQGDLSAFDSNSVISTFAEAEEYMNSIVEQNPLLEGELLIVNEFSYNS